MEQLLPTNSYLYAYTPDIYTYYFDLTTKLSGLTQNQIDIISAETNEEEFCKYRGYEITKLYLGIPVADIEHFSEYLDMNMLYFISLDDDPPNPRSVYHSVLYSHICNLTSTQLLTHTHWPFRLAADLDYYYIPLHLTYPYNYITKYIFQNSKNNKRQLQPCIYFEYKVLDELITIKGYQYYQSRSYSRTSPNDRIFASNYLHRNTWLCRHLCNRQLQSLSITGVSEVATLNSHSITWPNFIEKIIQYGDIIYYYYIIGGLSEMLCQDMGYDTYEDYVNNNLSNPNIDPDQTIYYRMGQLPKITCTFINGSTNATLEDVLSKAAASSTLTWCHTNNDNNDDNVKGNDERHIIITMYNAH